MYKNILIGCRGWNYDEWAPDFYPEELPEDWRFCFYSNEIRSVLVPLGDALGADPQQWREDCDEEFRFVFEYSFSRTTDFQWIDQLQKLLHHIKPVVDRTAAILMSPVSAKECTEARIKRILQTVGSVPVCLDLPDAQYNDGVVETLDRFNIGLAWRNAQIPISSTGRMKISLVDDVDIITLRKILEQLHKASQRGCGTGVFFTEPRKAPYLARQARDLAELLGV